jgi:hypothetical protein
MFYLIYYLLFLFSYYIFDKFFVLTGTGFAWKPTYTFIGYGIILGFGLVRLNYLGTVVFLLFLPRSSIFCYVAIWLSNAFLPVANSCTFWIIYSHFYFLYTNFGNNFSSKYGNSRCSAHKFKTFSSNN